MELVLVIVLRVNITRTRAYHASHVIITALAVLILQQHVILVELDIITFNYHALSIALQLTIRHQHFNVEFANKTVLTVHRLPFALNARMDLIYILSLAGLLVSKGHT